MVPKKSNPSTGEQGSPNPVAKNEKLEKLKAKYKVHLSLLRILEITRQISNFSDSINVKYKMVQKYSQSNSN